jgi:hypothetical protein
MMKISVEGESMKDLLTNIELLLLEFDGLEENPEADPKPVLERYDLTWGKMWELADKYEASGRLFTALLVAHTGQIDLAEMESPNQLSMVAERGVLQQQK